MFNSCSLRKELREIGITNLEYEGWHVKINVRSKGRACAGEARTVARRILRRRSAGAARRIARAGARTVEAALRMRAV